MNIKEILILISTILVLISPIIYIVSILKGESKPHRTTKIVYLLISFLSTYSLYIHGDRVGLWLSAATLFQSALVFFTSLKYGVGGWSKLDITCLIIAIIGIIFRQLTDNPLMGLAAAILADFIGTVPTIIKTWKDPSTEIRTYYGMDTIAGVLSLVALSAFSIADIAYPGYIFIVNLAMVYICLRKPVLQKDA